MSISAHASSIPSGFDPVLDDVIEEIANKIQAGEPVDGEAILARYPDRADSIRRLLPAMEVMAEFGISASRLAASGISPGISPLTGELGTLGDFRILREVGRGGMGIVYEAEQMSLGRRVALKVLPFAGAMDSHQLRRFRTEAQAAAQLHHTNIVPVFWIGSEQGVHYYAMQFIEGRTLADVIRELRQIEGKERSACRDGEDTAASALASAPTREFPLPAAGEAVTPSPAEADPSVRSTGRTETPPSGSSTRNRAYFRNVARLGVEAAEALEHAHQEGIVHRDIKPANLMIDARGHLWVTDFGLARLQADAGLTMTGDLLGTLRYMSPEQALARRGYLDHRTDIYSLGATLYELVTLRPAMVGQDRQEILRRIAQDEPTLPRRLNPSVPRELETILLKAMDKEPGSRYATAQEFADDLERFLDHKPIRARRTGLMERAAKWSRRHRAVIVPALLFLSLAVVVLAASTVSIARQGREMERQRDEARQAVDDMYTNVAEQWLEQQPALELLQRTLLQKALAYYQRFAGEASKDPRARLKTAEAYRRAAMILSKLGEFGESEAAFRRGMVILDDLVAGAPSTPSYRSELAVCLQELARLLRKIRRSAESEEAVRRAIALQDSLVAASPSDSSYRHNLAICQNGLGLLLWEAGRNAEAKPAFRRAVALEESLVAESPSNVEYRLQLAQIHSNLGTFLREPGHYAEAEQSLGHAIPLWAGLLADSPSVPRYRVGLAGSYMNLAQLLEAIGRPGDAEKAYRQAVALLERIVADSPSVPEYRNSLFKTLSNLGVFLEEIGKPADAEAPLRQAVTLQEKAVADNPSEPQYREFLSAGYDNLGTALLDMRRWAEAEQAIRKAIALRKQLVTDFPSATDHRHNLAGYLLNLGDLLAKTHRGPEAESAYRQSIALLAKPGEAFAMSEGPDLLVQSVVRLATHLREEGRAVEAEQEYRRAVALAERLANPGSQNELSWALVSRPGRGRDDTRLAIRLAKKAVEREPRNGAYWNTLGIANYRDGGWNAAIESLEKSMQLSAGGGPVDWLFLAMAHWRLGEKGSAEKWYNQAIDWIEKNRSQDEELHRFRDEAAALLGAAEHPAPAAGKKEEDTTRQPKP